MALGKSMILSGSQIRTLPGVVLCRRVGLYSGLAQAVNLPPHSIQIGERRPLTRSLKAVIHARARDLTSSVRLPYRADDVSSRFL